MSVAATFGDKKELKLFKASPKYQEYDSSSLPGLFLYILGTKFLFRVCFP
jgi:hypothetical protein